MNKNNLIEQIRQSGAIVDVEEIEYKPDFLVVRFFYDYDEDELDAARDYANSETSSEDDEDKWYDEFYIPYIIDLAVDEVKDTIEEIVDKNSVGAEYISYEPGRDDKNVEFIAVFANEGIEFDIDEILESIGI